jgi:hypothetical protein
VDDARAVIKAYHRVIKAYQATYKSNAALLPLVWGLDAHLKAFLDFGPI